MIEYSLYKISYPAWEFKSPHISNIRVQLEDNICDSCLVDDFFPSNYDELNDREKITELLCTSCGAEYFFDSEEIEEYVHGDYIW